MFGSTECVHSSDNIDQEFTASQSGGRIVGLDDNHIMLSVGDYRERYLAQKKNSINFKSNIRNVVSGYSNRNEVDKNIQKYLVFIVYEVIDNRLLPSEQMALGNNYFNLVNYKLCNNFDNDSVNLIKKAYRIIYRKGYSLKEAIKHLHALNQEENEALTTFISSIERSERGLLR